MDKSIVGVKASTVHSVLELCKISLSHLKFKFQMTPESQGSIAVANIPCSLTFQDVSMLQDLTSEVSSDLVRSTTHI